ncbi:hypothetical protein SDC9_103946 [bioreactor metagenome]|uniref:RNA polymerase sigma factor 54 DNA-binding domain-containing protein n=1 Tax=bioreactor metagenome TaxID=1076179 RepID=A0A645AV43_9ZZZZ
MQLHGVVTGTAGHAEQRHAQRFDSVFPAFLPFGSAGCSRCLHGQIGGVAQAAAFGDRSHLGHDVVDHGVALLVGGGAQVQRELAAAGHHVDRARGHVQLADGGHAVAVLAGALFDVQRQLGHAGCGIAALVPMTMAEVAQELGLHETTVSRAVANKYLETPQGLQEYRFFFSGGYHNADGEEISSRSVKAAIRQMIETEEPRKPLSDAAIAEKLSAQGLNVARRTVAKYRESLNIPPTNLRRHHQ